MPPTIPPTVDGKVDELVALDCKSFVPNDSLILEMSNVIAGNTQFPKAFIPNADGVLMVENLSGSLVPITVIKGLPYPIMVKKYMLTGTVDVTQITGLG